MIDAHCRHIARCETFTEHLNARAILSADDRSPNAGAEVAALHADFIGQGAAERRLLSCVQLFAAQDTHWLQNIFGVLA